MYPQAKEDELVSDMAGFFDLYAYAYQRDFCGHSYERLKNASYPNVEALEVRYREVMG